MGEIKNVKNLSLTPQLKDYINYCYENGYQFTLYIREGTQLSGPLGNELDRIHAIIRMVL